MLPAYLKLIDTKTTGNRNDVLPLFRDYAGFTALVEDLAALVMPYPFTYVAGVDALGFILGTAMALRFQVGFVAIRKAGKVPQACDLVEFVDYTGARKGLELAPRTLSQGDRVLLVDEWVETGAQVRAAARLIENQGGVVAAITGIAMERNAKTADLFERYCCVPLTDGRILGTP